MELRIILAVVIFLISGTGFLYAGNLLITLIDDLVKNLSE
jgi:hypothetical protein